MYIKNWLHNMVHVFGSPFLSPQIFINQEGTYNSQMNKFLLLFAFVLLSVFLIKWNARMAPYSRPTLYLVITVADYDRPPASLGQIQIFTTLRKSKILNRGHKRPVNKFVDYFWFRLSTYIEKYCFLTVIKDVMI